MNCGNHKLSQAGHLYQACDVKLLSSSKSAQRGYATHIRGLHHRFIEAKMKIRIEIVHSGKHPPTVVKVCSTPSKQLAVA